jgi:hypothetical protein
VPVALFGDKPLQLMKVGFFRLGFKLRLPGFWDLGAHIYRFRGIAPKMIITSLATHQKQSNGF